MNLTKGHIYKILAFSFSILAAFFDGTAAIAAVPEGTAAVQAHAEVKNVGLQPLDDGGYLLKLETMGLQQQEYPVHFTVTGLTNWSDYGAISFEIKNNSSIPVTPVIAVRLSPLVIVKAVGPCLWQEKDAEPLVIRPTNGGVMVLPGQQGKLLVPFSSLQYRGKKYPIGYFTGWNIQFNIPQDANVEMYLGKFSLHLQGERVVSDTSAAALIEGEDSVQAPIEDAESITVYHVNNDMPLAQFRLNKPYEGIAITGDGRLTVSSTAKPQTIRIVAALPQGQQVAKDVVIKPLDKIGVKDVYGSDIILHSASKVQPVSGSSSVWMENETYKLLRYVLIALFIVIGAILFYGFRTYKKHGNVGGSA